MIQAIVTDIEGTTSSLSFVKDVLFPYSHAHLGEFVRRHGREPAVRRWLDDVRTQAGRPLNDEEVIAQLAQWIAEDKKITSLKALQGMIWEEGYKRGDFTGHVYEDAARNLRTWHARGTRLYVYSSGSVQAQKLLFGFSNTGNLTPLFSGYFDTAIGGKREADSYRKIAAAISLDPASILFLSDIREELDAACMAGLRTIWLVRDGTLDTVAPHPQARTFDEVKL